MVSFEIGTLTIYSGHNLNSVKTTWCSINDSKFTFQPLEWTFYIWNTVSSMNGMAMKPMKHWRVTIFFGKIHLRLQSATRRWLTFLHKYIFGKSRSMTQLKINKVSYLQTAWTNIQIFQFELDQLDLALIRIVYLYTWRSSVHYSTDLSYFTNVSEMNVQWSIWMIGSIT